MRNRNIRSCGACLLAALLLICNSLPCHAAQIGFGAGPVQNESINIGEGAEYIGETPAAEKNYILKTDKDRISFGMVEQNKAVPLQNILLTNAGEEDIRFIWHKADYHDCITVDAPDHVYMRPGESCIFTVSADSSLEPGSYSALLMFADESDPFFEKGVQADISLEITKQTPHPPVITSVSISPGTAVVKTGSTCAFSASVAGENDYSREVVWSVSGQTSRNTMMDGNGVLHVGTDESASALTVRAASRQDGNYSASALVSLQSSSYFIQVSASPDNGGIVHGNSCVREGGRAVVSAAPNNGFVFDCWLLNGSRVSQNSQYTIDNIHSDGTYVASFKPVSCRITAEVYNDNGGTVTGGGIVNYGGSMTLTAAAKDGYQFDGWVENGVIVNKNSKMQLNNITEPRYFTAMFSQNRFGISLACMPVNTGSVSGQGFYAAGSNAKITAAPIAGYRFAGWTENGKVISADRECTINNVSRDMCLTAVFEKEQAKTYTITAKAPSSGGTVAPDGKSTVSEGAGMVYLISPKSGYTIENVYVDGKPVGAVASYSFVDIKGNHDISVDFAAVSKQDSDVLPSGSGVEEEAKNLTLERSDMELMEGALETGALQVTIHNDFADIPQETHYSSFYENSSATNFEMVLDHLLSDEEKLEMLQGNLSILINLYIDDLEEGEMQTVTDMLEEHKLRGMQIGKCFNMFLLESKPDDTRMILELPEELQVVLRIPESLKADNREFFIMRLHCKEDGSVEYAELADQDDDPDTISFSTDRFSPYAIAYLELSPESAGGTDRAENAGMSEKTKDIIGAVSVAGACAITLFLVMYLMKRRRH